MVEVNFQHISMSTQQNLPLLEQIITDQPTTMYKYLSNLSFCEDMTKFYCQEINVRF